MLPENPEPPTTAVEAPPTAPAPRRLRPESAAFEVVLCSDFPTQFAIGALLGRVGIPPTDAAGHLSARFVYFISAIDTVVLLGLIVLLLRLNGERPRDVFAARGRAGREAIVGLGLVPLSFGLVLLLQLAIHLTAPFLRTVPENPFQSLIGSPLQIAAFITLVLVAGGVREELQRAFLLHRFEQSLGGGLVGVVVTSLAFGAGHFVQGWDAVIVTALLGALWGTVYLRRRNVIATVISHALFNVGEVMLALYALKAAAP